jgi:light-regulated signal transduction histidine kinase (bacteriophytochrome)
MKDVKLSYTLNISKEEAQQIIDNYFDSFPGLKEAMDGYLNEVKRQGTVTSKFGRVRHLPRAREIYRKFGDAILDFKALPKLSFKHKLPMDELKLVRKEYNNLLNNAFQARSPERKFSVQITIEETNKGRINIFVSDNGVGIPLQEQKKIFTPHFTTKSSGSGLGLAMVKQIVENHNGSISFKSEPKKSTTFKISLPINRT